MQMEDRDAIISGFLAAEGWEDRFRAPLSGDASFRCYERLHDRERKAVLMNAPPDKEDVRPFWALACHLRATGFSAPEVIAGNCDAGLLLLEDFGDELYSRVVEDNPDAEELLYSAAVDLLVDLHQQPIAQNLSFAKGNRYRVPRYGEQLLLEEAQLFTTWYLPEVSVSAVAQGEKVVFTNLWRDLLCRVPATAPVLVLRDYHADNLIWLSERSGIARVGLLDFQDGVAGHPAYDLVSLLEDARRDVSPLLAGTMIERYVNGASNHGAAIDRDEFRIAYAILGAQRNTKIIGIFTRLWRRDKKPIYLELIPRVWGLLARDLEHPALTDLKSWYDNQVPAAVRATVPGSI